MVNAAKFAPGWWMVMLLAAVVLTSAAWLRGAEYDEQYTLFLTAGTPRPAWPETVFAAGLVRRIQSTPADQASIALDLRATDVHPPVYFWAFAIWRRVFGPGLFEGRLLSVLCGLISLAAVGDIARRCGIRPLPAMLLTLGSYGFVYTNAIARGFALAQTLTLCGFAVLIGTWRWRGRLAAGALFGAACYCNYLAAFIAIAVSVLAGGWLILPAAAPFLALDAWFFATQGGARVGQFPSFDLLSALSRLLVYQLANVFGGLPLYVDGRARIIVGAAVGSLALALLGTVLHARPLSKVRSAGCPPIHLLLAAALAPPGRIVVARRGVQQYPDRVALSVVRRPLRCAAHRLGHCPRGPCRIRLETVAADRCRIRPDPLDHWSSLSTQNRAAGTCHRCGRRTSGRGRRDPAAAWQRRRRDRRRVRHRGGPGPAVAAGPPDRFARPDTCPYRRLSPRRPCLGPARPRQCRQPAGHAGGFCRSRLASRRNRVQRRGV